MVLLVSIVLISLAWFTAEHFPPWVSWQNEICAFAAVMCALVCMLFSKTSRYRPVSLPIAGWPLALLALVIAIQTAMESIVFAGSAWVMVFYLTLCISALGLGYSAAMANPAGGHGETKDLPLISKLAILLLVAGLCSVVVAFVQTLDIWPSANWIHRMPGPRRPGANIGQANQLATFLLFALASLTYLFELRQLRVITAMPMAAILLVGLAITESRTGALSLLLMAAWWLLKRRQLAFVLSARAVGIWIAFFATSFWLWPSCINHIQMGSLDNPAATQVNLQAGTRLLIWPQLWQAVLLKPWLGWGLGEVSAAQNAILHEYAVSEPFSYAHNILLDLAVGIGLPLTLLLLVVTSVWFWHRVRDTKTPMSWYCLAVALPFGVHSMLEYPFAYAYLLVPVMVLLGVLEARLAPDRVLRISWWTASTISVFLAAAMAWSVREYVAVEEDFRNARFEILQVGQTPFSYERPRLVLLTQMDAFLEGIRIVPMPGMTLERIELAHKVAMKFPGVATQNRYALTLALNGNPEEAARQMKVMRAMHGEKTYQAIKNNWGELANSKYPQLKELKLP